MLHGDRDSAVAYCDGQTYASQEQSFNYWSRANRCSTTDTAAPLCDPQGITSVAEKDATGCARGTEVKFYKLLGGQHDWYTIPMNAPGSSPFALSLPTVTKHLAVLEHADLVEHWKVGRVRYCRLAPAPLERADDWIAHHRAFWTERFTGLHEYLRRDAGDDGG